MAQIVPIRSMVRKDLSQLLSNRSFMVTVLVTIVFNLLLPDILTFQIRDVNIALVSHDNSELAQHIVQDISYTRGFVISGHYATYEEAMELVKDGESDCIVEIPEHFERRFLRQVLGRKDGEARIQISANAINTTKVLAATQSIIGSIANTLRTYANGHGASSRRCDTFITTQNLYNPTFDYKLLMLPVMFISITLVFNIATRLITNELQNCTIDQIHVSPMSRFAFMTSKLASCYIVSMGAILASMLSLWLVYDFYPRGNFFIMILALTLYVLYCGSIALMLCNLLEKASQMVLFSSLFSLVAMMMSGYITPLECVADWLEPLSYLLPTRYVIIILRNVALKSANLADLSAEFIPLTLLTILFYLLSILTCKRSRE